MVSNAPNSQSLNFTHMWSHTDLRGPLPKAQACGNTLLGALENNPDFSSFRKIVALAKMEDIFNNIQANFTVFVPSDTFLSDKIKKEIDNMDLLKARQIIKASSLDNKISSESFIGRQSLSLVTRDRSNRIRVNSNNDETFLNETIKVVDYDLILENGIIHTVSKHIVPYSQV